jgi:hypothetical protein
MSHFRATRKGIETDFSVEEQMFLSDVLPLLAGVGLVGEDPAATRLNVPVYLNDSEANEEWWRLMGEDLNAGRHDDRGVYGRVMAAEGKTVMSSDEANAFLRVLNEARLALGARLGVEVEADHDELPEDSRRVLDYLGWVLEELTTVLTRSM